MLTKRRAAVQAQNRRNHTGQEIETIEEAMERDRFMAPAEAKEFGLIDEVVSMRPPPEDQAAKSTQSN